MKLYDAHSHLHFPENSDVLAAFGGSGNVLVCDCSVSEKDFEILRDTANALNGVVYPAYGIHPLFVPKHSRDFPKSRLAAFLSVASAVGEIGLDKKAENDYESQKECFALQLDMALAFGLPAVIHCRGAWGDLLAILKEHPLPRGILIHAANCSPEIARELSRLGAVFSFGVRELGGLRGLNCAASLPVGRILIESDADSNPALLSDALAAIADLKGESFERMGNIVEENFLRFFNGK
jgi:TatD DNase family protein